MFCKLNFNFVLPKKGYRADIDGLRAIAILAVVLFHTYPDVAAGGFIGVDVFFVISGYLITKIIYKALKSDTFSFYDFYARRVRRIFPAVLFLFLGVGLGGALLLTPKEMEELGSQIAWATGFSENIYLYFHTGGYWDTATEVKPLMHLWTLAVEEQYYLLYPLLLVGIYKYKKLHKPMLLVLWFMSFAAFCYFSFSNPTLAFFSLPTRFWELCSGCILAVLVNASHETPKSGDRTLKNGLSLLGIFIILSITFFVDGAKLNSFESVAYTLLAICSAAFIIYSKESFVNQYLLSSKPLVYIGLLSYTWYLWHWPGLAIARTINGGNLPNYWICTILLLIGVLLSLFSYFLVEAPIRRMQLSKKQFSGLLAGMGLCCMLGVGLQHFEGIPARLGESSLRLTSEMHNNFPWKNDYCKRNYPMIRGNRCWSDPNPTVAVIGDSHAWHLMKGFKSETQDNYLLLGHSSTPPFINAINIRHEKIETNHPTIMTQGLNLILSNEKIKTVVLSAMWPSYIKGYSVVSNGSLENRKGEAWLYKDMSEIIEKLLQNNKKVLLLNDVPNMRFKPESCVKSRPLFGEVKSPCGIKKEVYDADVLIANRVINRVAQQYPSIIVKDLALPLCSDDYCFSIMEGHALYRDVNHLSNYGSRLVIKELLDGKQHINELF